TIARLPVKGRPLTMERWTLERETVSHGLPHDAPYCHSAYHQALSWRNRAGRRFVRDRPRRTACHRGRERGRQEYPDEGALGGHHRVRGRVATAGKTGPVLGDAR